jgi:hypothetical protein
MVSLAIEDRINPGRHNVRADLGQRDLDQQAEQVFGWIDTLLRQAAHQLTPSLIRAAVIPPTDIDGVDGLEEVPLAI